MKTKKLVLNVLLGITICNSAVALSADDRQSFCEKYPDKYVWVAKTEACVPINPCQSTNESIKNSYCIEAPILSHDKLFERYISYNLNTGISSSKQLGENNFAFRLTDGGYIVFKTNKGFTDNTNFASGEYGATEEIIQSAFWVYGKANSTKGLEKNMVYSSEVESETICSEVANLSTLANGTTCTYDYGNTTCVIKCSDFNRENSVLNKN